MKKLLILILIALSFILAMYIGISGVQITPTTAILGINGIREKNSELDDKIQTATQLSEKTYTQAVSDVNKDAKKLSEEKQNYLDAMQIYGDTNSQLATTIEPYEVETLWVKIGNHATSDGVTMKMDITNSVDIDTNKNKDATQVAENITKAKDDEEDSGSKKYDLNFTVTGGYIQIEDFISSIENDTSLGFKVEEFKMIPSGNELQATFVCKDISIKKISATTTVPQDGNNANSSDTNTTANTTNTANNTNATNSTNTANNTNTTNTSGQ